MKDLNLLIKKEKLSDEDYKELIEQGMKILNKFITVKHYQGVFDNDEKYDIVYFSIVKATSNWNNEKKTKFTTYFSTIIKNRLCFEIVTKNREKNKFFNSCLSIDAQFNHKRQDTSDDVTSIGDILGQLDIYDIELESILNKLTEQEKNSVILTLQGYTNPEIAEKLNTSYSSVTSSLSKARKRIKKLYYGI